MQPLNVGIASAEGTEAHQFKSRQGVRIFREKCKITIRIVCYLVPNNIFFKLACLHLCLLTRPTYKAHLQGPLTRPTYKAYLQCLLMHKILHFTCKLSLSQAFPILASVIETWAHL
jgi:hypothetical protein